MGPSLVSQHRAVIGPVGSAAGVKSPFVQLPAWAKITMSTTSSRGRIDYLCGERSSLLNFLRISLLISLSIFILRTYMYVTRHMHMG